MLNTRDLLARIDGDPARLEHITLESSPSLPVLRGPDGRPEFAVFWFPVAGPIDDRRLYTPYYETVVRLDAPEQVTFGPLSAASLGIHPAPDGSIGPDAGPAAESQEEIDAQLDALYESLDGLAGVYLRPPGTLTEVDRSAARTYGAAFRQLADPALMQAYRAYSPDFFAWIRSMA